MDRVIGPYTMIEAKAKLTAVGAPPKMANSVATIVITATADGVALKPAGQSAVEMAPRADGTFYNADLDVRIRIDVPPSGPVTSVTLEEGQLKLSYHR